MIILIMFLFLWISFLLNGMVKRVNFVRCIHFFISKFVGENVCWPIRRVLSVLILWNTRIMLIKIFFKGFVQKKSFLYDFKIIISESRLNKTNVYNHQRKTINSFRVPTHRKWLKRDLIRPMKETHLEQKIGNLYSFQRRNKRNYNNFSHKAEERRIKIRKYERILPIKEASNIIRDSFTVAQWD